MQSFGSKAIFAFKIIVSIAGLGYVTLLLINFENWEVVRDHFLQNSSKFMIIGAANLLLTTLNISLEALKWKVLLSSIHHQSFRLSIFQVLKGFVAGLTTPARSGEGISRALYLPEGYRINGFLLSTAGSMVQNTVILTGGIIGVLLATGSNGYGSQFLNQVQYWLIFSCLVVVAIAITGYLTRHQIVRLARQIISTTRVQSFIEVTRQVGAKRVLTVIFLTITRYFIYSFQLWLMLHLMGVVVPLEQTWLIPVYLAVITIIPSIAIADLSIRGSAALLLFGTLASSHGAIFVAIFMVWCFNLALPAMIAILIKLPATKNS